MNIQVHLCEGAVTPVDFDDDSVCADVITGRSPDDLYIPTLLGLLKSGHVVRPRGMVTRERLGVTTVLKEPTRRLFTNPKRRVNAVFNLLESAWILAGRKELRLLAPYNSQFLKFVVDGAIPTLVEMYSSGGERAYNLTENAPYGWRIRNHFGIDQLADCLKALQKDYDTRQAVMVLWDPKLDNSDAATKDRPCNDLVMFNIRNVDGKHRLYMTVINRSNDLTLGLYNVNFIQFSTIQEAMASILGIEVGTYRHYSNSLHVYIDEEPWNSIQSRIIAGAFVNGKHVSLYDIMQTTPCPIAFETLEEMDTSLCELFEYIDDLNQSYAVHSRTELPIPDFHNPWVEGIARLATAYILMLNGDVGCSLAQAMKAFDSSPEYAIMFLQTLNHKFPKHATVIQKEISVKPAGTDIYNSFINIW